MANLEDLYNASIPESYSPVEEPAPTPGGIQSQLAIIGGDPAALENRVLDLRAGNVDFAPRPHWKAGGAFGPRDLFNAGAMAVGGVAGLAGAGARGIATYGARQASIEGLRDPVEMLFQEAVMRAPDIGSRLIRHALGVTMAGGAGVSMAGGDDQQSQKAADRSTWNYRQASTDAATMSVKEFKQKYGGMLPEQVLTHIEDRNTKNPPGFFKKMMGR